MNICCLTNCGNVRAVNEDAYFISADSKFAMIADGVGGGKNGALASKLAVEEIFKSLSNKITEAKYNDKEISHLLVEAFQESNDKIVELADQDENSTGMATTGTAIFIYDEKAFIVNIGDSRAYLFRKEKLDQITIDHTLVSDYIKQGKVSEAESVNHPQKHVITKALGINGKIEPDVFKIKFKKEDLFLLCTDGLYNEVTHDEMRNLIKNHRDQGLDGLCKALLDVAISREGKDNITVMCIKKEIING